MSNQLDEFQTEYDRADQDTKRAIGEYLYRRPAQWVAKQEIAEVFEIDPSVAGRHLDDFYEDGFVVTSKIDGQKHAQWDGRGAGGVRYWLRELVPQQLWMAGSELRPLFTLESLGGAYVPTLLFGVLVLMGFITGLFVVLVAYLPTDSALGVTVTDLVFLSGIITVMASVFLLLVPFARLLEVALVRAWNWGVVLAKNENQD